MAVTNPKRQRKKSRGEILLKTSLKMEKVTGTEKVAGENEGLVRQKMGIKENMIGKTIRFYFHLQFVQYRTKWVEL